MEVTRVFDILDLYKSKYKKDDLLCCKENKQWKKYSSDDFINYSNWTSYGLINMGLKPGDKVAIVAHNCPEWVFSDYGCQQAGIVTVPIFPTISNNDLKFILNHAEVKAVFISDKKIYAKFTEIEKEIPTVKHIISFHKVEGLPYYTDFIETAKQNPLEEKTEAIKKSVSPEDLLTILYTSGTTGTDRKSVV